MKREFVMIRADEENGCEECWHALRKQLPEVDALFDHDLFGWHRVARTTWKRISDKFGTCPHNPPQHAQSIFVSISEDRYQVTEKAKERLGR